MVGKNETTKSHIFWNSVTLLTNSSKINVYRSFYLPDCISSTMLLSSTINMKLTGLPNDDARERVSSCNILHSAG